MAQSRRARAIEHHRDRQVVGHELAAVHEALGLEAQLGLVFQVVAEEIATGHVGGAPGLLQPICLRTLTWRRGGPIKITYVGCRSIVMTPFALCWL